MAQDSLDILYDIIILLYIYGRVPAEQFHGVAPASHLYHGQTLAVNHSADNQEHDPYYSVIKQTRTNCP